MATTKGINLQFPLTKSPQGAFETNKTTISAVTDDLKILILTNFGERPIQYDFGANLRSVIFEQGPSMEQKIKDLITIAVNKWMPFVILNDIAVLTADNSNNVLQNEVRVRIFFSVGALQGALDQSIKV